MSPATRARWHPHAWSIALMMHSEAPQEPAEEDILRAFDVDARERHASLVIPDPKADPQ